jgi:ABC-type branched-subunit amino acid transport system ATPase component
MLHVDGLRVDLGGVSILRGISFHAPAGATVAIVGRNGAGKTTTLRAIMGLVPIAGGTITLDGRALTSLPPHARPRHGVGYAPEDRQMIAALTVEDNLRLPAQACGLGAARTAARLDLVYGLLPELRGWRARFAGTLSGGQQRLVALGRAAMTASRLLLLDEPFQGIAPALAARYTAVLEGLRRTEPQLSIVIAESNLASVAALAEVPYTIERGQLTAP